MKKRKTFEDKKRELDEQVVAIAAKKSKLQKETPPAPSESEIDMGVFSAKRGNVLEKIYFASAPQGKGFALEFWFVLPPEDLGEKEKQVHVKVEQVREGGGDGVGACDDGGDGRGKGVDTEAESSEATHHLTIYTRRPPASGDGATSGIPRSHEFENFPAGSWDTHNPTCDDLPHAPRWNLTQGSRMNDHDNCREFFSLSLPPAERLFQKRRDRFDLLDYHIHVGVNFFATSQEIVREWKLMVEETLEFENEKKAFAEEEETFNAEKKRLLWRVSDAEQKPVQEKQFNSNKQKEWEISEEAEQERVASQKREEEYLQRIAKLGKFVAEKVAECKASELLAEEVSADCKWLLARAVPLISERIEGSEELAKYMYELGEAARDLGRKEGYAEGRAAAESKEPLKNFELYKIDYVGRCAEKR
ncbi:hypothetical protein Hanom_Chr06g00540831 [Helianthus anomalus]